MKREITHILRPLFLAITLVFCCAAYAEKTYVVAVGITNYKYPDIAPRLPCSEGDVRAVANFFHNYNGCSVFMLLDKNATRAHILTILKREFAKASADDEIIFVYSGHGVQGGLTSYETQTQADLVTYNEIQDIMKASKAKRKVIIAMACYSGGLTLSNGNRSNSGRQRYGRTQTQKTSVLLYTSSRANEQSWESSAMRQSFFISRLIEAFSGKADANGDKKITARETFNYVNPRVIQDTNQKQHPQMWGSFDDNMVLVRLR